MPPLEKLFCYPLEKALKFWGWFNVVNYVLAAICFTAILFILPDKEIESSAEMSQMEVIVLFSVLTGFAVVSIITSYMLVMAVNKRNRVLLLPFLILNGILYIVVFIPLELYTDLHDNSTENKTDITDTILTLLGSLLAAGLYVYFIYGVYSLFVRLRNEETYRRNGTSTSTATHHAI